MFKERMIREKIKMLEKEVSDKIADGTIIDLLWEYVEERQAELKSGQIEIEDLLEALEHKTEEYIEFVKKNYPERVEDFGFVLATKMLVDGKRKVRFMYHERPDNPQDSGWRFFCGDEDDEYISDPDNIGVYDVKTILEIDGSILPYLDAPTDMAFEREYENSRFVGKKK